MSIVRCEMQNDSVITNGTGNGGNSQSTAQSRTLSIGPKHLNPRSIPIPPRTQRRRTKINGDSGGAMTPLEIFNNAHSKQRGLQYDPKDEQTHAFSDEQARRLRMKIRKFLYDGQNEASFRIERGSLCYRDAQKKHPGEMELLRRVLDTAFPELQTAEDSWASDLFVQDVFQMDRNYKKASNSWVHPRLRRLSSDRATINSSPRTVSNRDHRSSLPAHQTGMDAGLSSASVPALEQSEVPEPPVQPIVQNQVNLPSPSLERTYHTLPPVPSKANDTVPPLGTASLPSSTRQNPTTDQEQLTVLGKRQSARAPFRYQSANRCRSDLQTANPVNSRSAYFSDSSDDEHLDEDATPRNQINQRTTHPNSVLADIYGPSQDELRRVLPPSSGIRFAGRNSSAHLQPSPNIDEMLDNPDLLAHIEQQIKKRKREKPLTK